MPALKRKAYAYVTNRDRLLVFSHPHAPEAGIQVPAGTIEPGEHPRDAVLREAREETGLDGLQVLRFLGDDVRDMRDIGKDEVHHRYFFHLACDGDPPARWRNHEISADDRGATDPPPLFELFWADLPGGVPPLLADHDRMLRWLVEVMGLAGYHPPSRVAASPDDPDLRERLAHVRFLGGPPDAGKSTVAQLLVERHGVQRYTFDNWAPRHAARMDPAAQSALHAFCMASMDERWMLPTPEQMADQAIRLWTERFWMMIEDLLALPSEPLVLAEGPGLFPECVARVIARPDQAIWLLPTEEFKCASALRRDKPQIRHGTSDPERATRNWLARDLLFGEHLHEAVERFGLASLLVDGERSAEQIAEAVEAHFGWSQPTEETR
jgi:8-oxo-dGTP pyrophosphatase MutT (NUDIX family)